MGYQGGSLAPALAKRGQISQPGPGTQYCGFPTLGVVVGINEDADTIDVVEKYGNKSWWGIKPGDMVTPEGSGSGTFPTVGTEIVIDIGGNGNCIVFARGGTGGSADGEKPVAGETVLSAGGRAKLKLSPNGGTAYGSGLAQIVNSPSGGQAQFSKTLDMGSLGGGIKTTGTDPKGAAGLAVTGNEKVGDVGGGAMLALGGKDGAILASRAPGSGASVFPAISIAASSDPIASAAAAKALMGAVKALQKLGSDGIALLAGAVGVSLGGPKIALVADTEITIKAPKVNILGALSVGGGGGAAIMNCDIQCKNVKCGQIEATKAAVGGNVVAASNADLAFLINQYNTHVHLTPNVPPTSKITGIPKGLPKLTG